MVRKTDPKNVASRVAIKPAEMPGLGYLPESVEAILAIQLPLLLEKMGPEAQKDPSAALLKLGVPQSVVETLERASGVGLKNVDQIVMGVGFEKGSLPPQLFVIVHSREPFDIDAVVRQSKASTLKKDGRTLHSVKGTALWETVWWSPNDRVLISTLLPRDYESVPLEPRTGIEHLRSDLTRLLRERIPSDAVGWLVASSDRWAQHLKPYTWMPMSPLKGRDDLLGPAERFRSATMSIPQAEDGGVEVRIDLKTAQAADVFRGNLRQRFEGEEIEVGGNEESVTIRSPFEPARFGSILSRLIVTQN
jgi:hypothetical protein